MKSSKTIEEESQRKSPNVMNSLLRTNDFYTNSFDLDVLLFSQVYSLYVDQVQLLEQILLKIYKSTKYQQQLTR